MREKQPVLDLFTKRKEGSYANLYKKSKASAGFE